MEGNEMITDNMVAEKIDYERSVLGCMLFGRKESSKAFDMIDEDCFSDPANKKVFQAIQAVHDSESAIEIMTVNPEFLKNRNLAIQDPELYIADIMAEVESPAGLEPFCDTLTELSERKNITDLCIAGMNLSNDRSKPVDEIIDTVQDKINKIGAGRKPINRPMVEIYAEAYKELQDIRNNGASAGIRTGFSMLDKSTDGLKNGASVTLAAKTSQGKTALALDMVLNIAKQNIPVMFFSLEMPDNDIADRLVAKESLEQVSGLQFRNFPLPDGEKKYWGKLSNGFNQLGGYPLFFEATPSIPLNKLRIKIEKAIKTQGVKIVFIDYLQLIQGNKSENRRLEIESITRALKQFALQYDIPIVALSQLSRNIDYRGEEHRPVLADLRESGSIEQDADIVMFIHNATTKQKQEYGLKSSENNENIRELIIRKNRNGECCKVLLLWKPKIASFGELYRD
jgi:replicative DNA helicase